MCGIAGIVSGQPVGPECRTRVASMLSSMRHRGPDGTGTHDYAYGSFGMVRLALVDLSERGQQPLWSPDNRVGIIFNGEIYNHVEHRERLKAAGYPFRSSSDTEVILALYLERGVEFVKALRGMYAVALFDFREAGTRGQPTVVLARGPLGIKPFYVATPAGDPTGLIFSSELKGMLASGLVESLVDEKALRDYLSFGFVVQPRSMIRGVRQIEPGVMYVREPGRPARELRFDTIAPSGPPLRSLAKAAPALREALEESVRLHSMADAKVGAFLSGGVDSSAIVALMVKHNPAVRTYTIRLSDGASDESTAAESFARQLGCEHTNVDVTDEMVKAAYPRFVEQLDQPSTDGFNTWLVSRAAAKDVKGVLSGVGGDEWFSGYPSARRMWALESSFSGRALREVAVLTRHVPDQLIKLGPASLRKLRTRNSPVDLWSAAHSVFGSAHQNATILNERYREALGRARNALEVAEILDVNAYLQGQLLRDSDATSMAHSLELRVPLVDIEVAAFAKRCDPHLLIDERAQPPSKRVLFEAVKDLLPQDMASRPKKGFALPYGRWLTGPLSELVNDLKPIERLKARGWLPESLTTKPSAYPQLWALTVLELWAQSTLERAPQVASAAVAPPDASASAR